MLDIDVMKIDVEGMYQEAVRKVQELECKYGFNEEDEYQFRPEMMSEKDKIEYEVNKAIRFRLFYILNEYINPNIMKTCECGTEYGSNQGYCGFCSPKCYDKHHNSEF